MSPAKVEKSPIASLTTPQVLAVLTVFNDHARSHGLNFERASAVAHAGLDIACEWLAAQ